MEKANIFSIKVVLGSCNRYCAIKSAPRYTTAVQRQESGKEMLSPTQTGFAEGRLQVATLSATILETAVWYPAAVREKEMERTGPKSW